MKRAALHELIEFVTESPSLVNKKTSTSKGDSQSQDGKDCSKDSTSSELEGESNNLFSSTYEATFHQEMVSTVRLTVQLLAIVEINC